MSKYYVDDNYFSVIDTESKAYFVGYLMADGSFVKESHGDRYTRLSLHVSQVDMYMVERLKHELRANYKIYVGSKFNDCALRVTSTQIVRDLTLLGMTPRKTGSEYINLDLIPIELHRHVFRGLIDGDGWITFSESPTTGRPIYSIGLCGSKEICEQFTQYIHNALGVGAISPSKVKDKNCYKIGYTSFRDIAKIVYHLYNGSSIYLPRKLERALWFDKSISYN